MSGVRLGRVTARNLSSAARGLTPAGTVAYVARMSAGGFPAATTATGTASRNVDGDAIALTVLTTFKWWGRVWVGLVFVFARLCPPVLAPLMRLRFIHFARWATVRRLPYNGPPQRKGRLRYAHLYFETNFNGGWEEYIDAFSFILAGGPTRYGQLWATYGFPDPLPTWPFKDFIRRNEVEATHFYSAYPESTTSTVLNALELDRQLDVFLRQTGALDDDEAFAAAWRRFLTKVQRCL
jgi:hypothetical protein